VPIDADALPNDPIVLQELLRELFAENDKLGLLIPRLTRRGRGADACCRVLRDRGGDTRTICRTSTTNPTGAKSTNCRSLA
jgi:hypothetical protein